MAAGAAVQTMETKSNLPLSLPWVGLPHETDRTTNHSHSRFMCSVAVAADFFPPPEMENACQTKAQGQHAREAQVAIVST